MPTTSNFGWTTPADTDLVKDGAAAIRTLGNGIDTSLVDLKGGTTGQILSKASNTDLDYAWINNDQGDITEVTAGTGITGGGTTGAVTITNDMATTITAAGDIVVGTGSGTYDNLPIGTTGQVLTADTSVSPYKVKWASAGAFQGARATTSTGTSLVNATNTALSFNQEDYDTDGFHSTTTNNSRMTIPSGLAGKYLITAAYVQDATTAGTQRLIVIRKNGTAIRQNDMPFKAYGTQYICATVDAAVGDYFEIFAYQDSSTTFTTGTATTGNYFDITFLGA